MRTDIRLSVNGRGYDLTVDGSKSLAEVLRDELDFKGLKIACEQGECGACTVLVDDRAVNSCLMLAVQAQGKAITTIEGLADGDRLDPVQQAFVDKFAVQCGYCTPGIILSAKALLLKNPNPSETEIREAIAGNLCRCTGYVKIVEAVMAASGQGQVHA